MTGAGGREQPPALPRPTRFVVEAAGPLYERVPTRDADGTLLADFMLRIPGLREREAVAFAAATGRLNALLLGFREIVFAELNLPLNLLWVSVRPRPGVVLEIAGAVRLLEPGALLVGEYRA